MSLKKNILANYASQIYVTIIGIVMVPLYVKYMGDEAYGLVGFFVVLQAWFQLLDMGLVPTMARQAAMFSGGATSALSFRRLLRTLECVFLCVAMLGAAVILFGASDIADYWLKFEQLMRQDVIQAIRLMGLIVLLRAVSELYRGVISGFEEMVWLSTFNSIVATARYVLVLPVFIFVGTNPSDFFAFQLIVAIGETLILMRKAYAMLPAVPGGAGKWHWGPLREVMGFSLGMSAASLAWVLVSQTDKLLLSSILTLADYGRLTLAVLAAGGVVMLASPLSAVLLPRLTSLHARGDGAQLLILYRQATQWTGMLAWPACAVLAWQAERVLWIWTGDAQLASEWGSILCLYALGNGLLTCGAFPYYLQFARGQLRLHLLGTGVFVLVLLPSLFWAASSYGAIGAGWVWLSVNAAYLVFWVPFAHAKQSCGLHWKWLSRDVVPIAALAFVAALVSTWLPWPTERFNALLQLLAASIVVLLAGAMGSSWLRNLMSNRLQWRP